MKSVSTQTLIRTAVLFLTLINNVLIILGKNPLPFSEDELYVGISAVASVVTSLWAWWKNNSFTQAAIEGDALMKSIKNKKS